MSLKFNFSAIIESTVAITVSQALAKAEQASFNMLRAARQECLDYYENEILAEHGGNDSYLKNFFGIKNGETNQWEYRSNLILEHVPITQQLVDLKAKNYMKQPERKIAGVAADKYTALLKASGFFPYSKRIEQMTQLLHDIGVGVFKHPVDKRLYFQIVPDYYPIFDPNDTQQLDPVAIIYATAKRRSDKSVIYAYYDKDRFVELGKTVVGDAISFDAIGEEIPNEAGVFPFFFPHRKCPVLSHFSQPRIELAQTNRAIDVAIVALNNLMRANGFKQFLIVGGSEADAKRLAMGNAFAIHIDTPQSPDGVQPSAEVIDMQGDFRQHLDAINFKMERATNLLNLIVDWRIEGGPQLPGTLKLQNARDTEDRETQTEILDAYLEQPMFKIVKALAKTHQLPMDKGEELIVDWPEAKAQTTPEQDMAREKQDIELNLANPVDMLKERNPDLSDQEAVKKLMINVKFNKVYKSEDAEEKTLLSILDGVDVDVEGIDTEPTPADAEPAGEGEAGGGAVV